MVTGTEKGQSVNPPLLRDNHFYILLGLFIACTVLYYLGEIVIFFGWEALRWPLFYSLHDWQRVLFLVPVLYSSAHYRWRGAILANIVTVFIFLSRAILIPPYFENIERVAFFIVIALVFSVLTVLMFNQRDRLNKSIDALKQSEEKNRVVLEQMYESYYEIDLAGNFTLVNESVCRNLGYSKEELIGSNYRMVIPDDDVQLLLLGFNEVFRTGEPNESVEYKILRKDGSIIQAETSIALRKNQQGKIIGFRSISRDITGRKQAEEDLRLREAHLQGLVNILQYDTPAISDFLDYALDEAIKLTGSKIGYIYYYDEDKAEFTLNTWSKDVMKECTVAEKKTQYHLEKTGIWGEAVRQRKPIIVNDFQSPHPLKKGYPEGHAMLYKYLTVPVIREDRIVAVVGVANKQSDYTQTDVLQLTLLMDSVWKAVYSKQMELQIRERMKELKAFYGLAELGARDDITMDNLYQEVANMLPASWQYPEIACARVVIGDIEFRTKNFMDSSWKQSAPVKVNGKVIGRIEVGYIEGRPGFASGPFLDDERLLLDAFAERIGRITERKQLEQKLEEMATHDFLTGLPNRVLLLDRFTMAAALAHRNKARLAVLSLDLDKFKLINDTYGHDVGDQVLKIMSTRLTGLIRASDTLARVGGDEFVLVMMETNHVEDSRAIAQKILGSFREPLDTDGQQLFLSTSIGIAIYPDDAEDLDTLTRKSDAAMYYSKGHGRDQFKFFGDGDVLISGDHKSGK